MKGKLIIPVLLLSFVLGGCAAKQKMVQELVVNPTQRVRICGGKCLEEVVMAPANQEMLKDYHTKMNFDDPYDVIPRLREREYVVPHNVLQIYAHIVDNVLFDVSDIKGGNLSRNFLAYGDRKDHFEKKLKEAGYQKEEINEYINLFSEAGIRVYSDEAIKDKEYYPTAISHERMHEEIGRLNKAEKNIIQKAADDLVYRRHGISWWLSEKFVKGGSGFFMMAAHKNWEEFYTHMADGRWEDFVEETLKEEYPQAYEVYLGVKERSRFK